MHSLLFREIQLWFVPVWALSSLSLSRPTGPVGRTEVNLCPFALDATSLDLQQSVESHQILVYISCCSRTRNTPYTPYASRPLCTICWCSVKVQRPLSLTVSVSLMTGLKWHAEVTSEPQWQCGLKLLVCSHTHSGSLHLVCHHLLTLMSFQTCMTFLHQCHHKSSPYESE